MRAIQIDRFGGPDVLRARDLEAPTAGPGQVLVRVHAAAVNPVDTKIRSRGADYGLEPPIVLGYDAAGVVEAVGEGVDDLEVGEYEVM